MNIHVVQPGDTIYTIADLYGVSIDKLIRDNELQYPIQLVPGETIVIVYPAQSHTVQEGDTLESIAATYNITVNELLRNNSFITNMGYIYPGEELTISYNRTQSIATHGYVNTFVNRQTFRKTLPYLTYLTVFNYRTAKNGEVITTSDDTDIIQISKDYSVIPLMLMTTLTAQGETDLELTYEVLVNEEVQNRLFDNVLNIVREKGYYGVNISAQFITVSNQALFYNYTRNLANRLRQEGYLTMITINPRVERVDNNVVFEDIDYSIFGSEVDVVLFLQYKWGFNYGPPSPVISYSDSNIFLDYALSQISQDKVFSGFPTLGYDWELPFVPGFSRASALTIDSVMNLARDYGVNIEFDEVSQTPHFRYERIGMGVQHEVWFINANTINSMLNMMIEKGMKGTGIWNIMMYFAQLWLVLNSQYSIIKLLPEI